MNAARALPSGTVTFLFTDIEGSTRLLHELGAEAYVELVTAHRRALRDAFAAHGGVEVDTQGDAFFAAFPSPDGAVAAAAAGREALVEGPIRVRIGIHTGQPTVTDEGYVGADVHLGARIAAAGHGGQVLLSQTTRALVDVEGTDLGEHRLKDFAEPVAIFQLGAERFPPLRTISNTNLPRPASSFVGREAEVAEVAAHLRDGARLLTLTGPGGSGKTRLAIETATELVPEFRAGVFWVGLATLRDPTLVAASIAQTLGAKDGLAEHIGEREMLLLLDNLEQVVEAAPELATLVEACSNLRLLVTSRERLRVRGEVEYPVQPLAERDAAELFSARSGLEPDATIAELCRRLDDLPLAVELAAARTSVLTPAQILERMSLRLDLLKGGRDAEARQATLRSTIEWSHDLLTLGEQRLFARLAVFVGGSTLEAAAAVIDADLDLLQSLVDKSLVRHTTGRFWMLETIREFAGERLESAGQPDALRRRHAEHFLAVAEDAEPHLVGGDSMVWLDRLELELDNFRAALDYLESRAETQLALRLAGALIDFWDLRALHREGLTRFERLLVADARPTSARAKGLIGVSQTSAVTGDLDRSLESGEEALTLSRSLGDAELEAFALWAVGYVHIERGGPIRAETYCEEAVRLLREIGATPHLPWAIRTLAFAVFRRGDLERARPLYEEALRLAQANGDQTLEAVVLGGLSGIALEEGRLADAASLALPGLTAIGDSGDWLMRTSRICVAAEVLAALGQASVAAELLGFAEAQHEDIGAREPWVEQMNARTVERVRAQLDDVSLADSWERGRRLTLDAALATARRSLRTQ